LLARLPNLREQVVYIIAAMPVAIAVADAADLKLDEFDQFDGCFL
jgi:hypothetical protein